MRREGVLRLHPQLRIGRTYSRLDSVACLNYSRKHLSSAAAAQYSLCKRNGTRRRASADDEVKTPTQRRQEPGAELESIRQALLHHECLVATRLGNEGNDSLE